MSGTRYTHVSILATDIEESVEFYQSVFGMEQIPVPKVDEPTRWLACGDLQLHIVERADEPPVFSHHALHVDDFEAVYEAILAHDHAEAELRPQIEAGYVDGEPPVYVLPSGAVQFYIRDPAGNLVEVNSTDAEALDDAVVGNLVERTDVVAPGPDEAAAPIYVDG
ncbi:MAG: VOC family protein [Halobellus sp.]|uniref:VOC family protein n=1 Tax=Halobellus sp. TaxID=1979212 RepID=UPI0035D4134F